MSLRQFSVEALKAKGFIRDDKGFWHKPEGPKTPQDAPAIKPAILRPPKPPKPRKSELEAKFEALWSQFKGPELKEQQGLIPGRLFKVDYLHEPTKTVIEIEGFRDHASKKGFKRDAGKYFTLDIDLDYRVIRLTRELLTEENIEKLIRRIRSRT